MKNTDYLKREVSILKDLYYSRLLLLADDMGNFNYDDIETVFNNMAEHIQLSIEVILDDEGM